mgnify:CR=1 FL=1
MSSYNVFPLFSALADTDTRYSAREEGKEIILLTLNIIDRMTAPL